MNKSILRLAIPNIISNITVPLLGILDMFIMGHLEHHQYIGGLALANTLFNIIYMPFMFLRMSTSGFTAQVYGLKNQQEQVNILLRAIFAAALIGLLLISAQSFIGTIGFNFFEDNELAKIYAKEYFSIYIWAAPAVLGISTISGWFIGMQDAKTPMFIAIMINIINIALSFFFVYGLGMQIKGVALASTIAQYTGFLLSLICWYRGYNYLKYLFNLKTLKSWRDYTQFFKVNTDIFIRTAALMTVTTYFMSASSKISESILAANALLMQLFILFSYFMDGFAYAAEALTGKYIGEKATTKLITTTKQLFKWGIGIALAFTIIYISCADQILEFFLRNKIDIIDTCKKYKIWAMLFPIAGFAAFLWDGIFIGATASKQMRNSMLIAAALFFISYSTISLNDENNSLWFAFILYLASRGVIQTFMSQKILNHQK